MKFRLHSLTLLVCTALVGVRLAAAQTSPVRFHDRDISLTLSAGAAKDECNLTIESSSINRSSVFSIPNPPRIVVDLFGPLVTKNSVVQVNNQIISTMRIGHHADKTRIVLDIKTPEIPPYNWSEFDKGANLRINHIPAGEVEILPDTHALIPENVVTRAAVTPSPAAPKVTPSALPTATVVYTETPDELIEEILASTPPLAEETPTPAARVKPGPFSEKSRTPTNSPTPARSDTPTPNHTPTSVAEPAIPPHSPTPTSAAQAVMPARTASPAAVEAASPDEIASLEFGRSGEKPVPTVKIKLGSKTEFELQKADEKTYSIKIPRLKLMRPALKLPQFPPHDFAGFNMVLLKETPDGVEGTIAVERGVRLSAAPNNQEIWITIAAESTQLTKSPPGIHPHPKYTPLPKQ